MTSLSLLLAGGGRQSCFCTMRLNEFEALRHMEVGCPVIGDLQVLERLWILRTVRNPDSTKDTHAGIRPRHACLDLQECCNSESEGLVGLNVGAGSLPLHSLTNLLYLASYYIRKMVMH
ncbi:hypothetical protein GWK47_020997 [Chionoecetes opilio]|uniref:Uncharacterized protein n=1 Tax=Chionoecetes opilio TaxID=41210 RepID=A0A8J4XPC1_CHIOP|nr:hypothetical protein GWK47_020997 [Chionoecetes opilio]